MSLFILEDLNPGDEGTVSGFTVRPPAGSKSSKSVSFNIGEPSPSAAHWVSSAVSVMRSPGFVEGVRTHLDSVDPIIEWPVEGGQSPFRQGNFLQGANGASFTLSYTYDANGNWLTKVDGTITSYYL